MKLEGPDHEDGTTLRWVIVGSSGFVGRALSQNLEARGAHVLRLQAPRVSASGGRTLSDLINGLSGYQQEIGQLAQKMRPGDIVINAAGVADPGSLATDELFGANSVLPGVVAKAATQAGARRFLHLSSAAVQGNVRVLTAKPETFSFSPYSESKAKGEAVVAAVSEPRLAVTIVRATSVQGPGRRTTENLQKIARSPMASVAKPGTQPTSVSSIYGLVDFVLATALNPQGSLQIVLQPWEGGTVRSVLEIAGGGRKPTLLPARLCNLVLAGSQRVSMVLGGRFSGHVRRLELMWFGQGQEPERDAERKQGVGDNLVKALTPKSLPQGGGKPV